MRGGQTAQQPRPQDRRSNLWPLSNSRPFPKRQRAGAVQDLADIPLLHHSVSQPVRDALTELASTHPDTTQPFEVAVRAAGS